MAPAKIEAAVELTKTNIFDAATADILAFAKAAAGLTFEENAGRDYIISEIFRALEWEAYKAEDDATHVVINLPITKDEKHPYRGGVNGKMFTIKRGVDVEVPIEYYNSMVDAAARRFVVENIPESGDIQQGSPARNRIPLGALDMKVVRFLKKGKSPIELKRELAAREKAAAKKAAVAETKEEA